MAAEQTADDAQDRLTMFIEKYKALVEELNVDFATYPVYTPDSAGGFRTIVQTTPVDMANRPKKEQFVAPEKS